MSIIFVDLMLNCREPGLWGVQISCQDRGMILVVG